MTLSKTNMGLLAIATLSAVVYLAYLNVYKKSNEEKEVGKRCKFKEGEPEGFVIYDFPLKRTAQNVPAPSLTCKRCNPTGCATKTI
jgi:hypothetical protein